MRKKIVFLLLSLVAIHTYFVISPKNTSAVGQQCCDTDLWFNENNNKCYQRSITTLDFLDPSPATGLDGKPRLQTRCAVNEVCSKSSAAETYRVNSPISFFRNQTFYRGASCALRPTIPQTGPGVRAGGGGACTTDQIPTAIGCLETNPGKFATQAIRVGVGIGSGVAFLMIILGSYKIVTSQGMPDGINQGKDTLTSAIIGLIFIILTVTIVQIIGFDILGLGALGLGTR